MRSIAIPYNVCIFLYVVIGQYTISVAVQCKWDYIDQLFATSDVQLQSIIDSVI